MVIKVNKPSTVATEVHIKVSPDKYATTPLQAMQILDNVEQAVLSILEEEGVRNVVAVSSQTGEPIYRAGGWANGIANPMLERMLVGSHTQVNIQRQRAIQMHSSRLVDEVHYHDS